MSQMPASWDVIVVGGGLGGVAAATAAARAGARTLLVERHGCLGGVATAGMVCSIFNAYFTGGTPRRLAVGGIALEVADRLATATGYGTRWRAHKGHVIYDLERGKAELAELVTSAGAAVLLDALVTGVVRDGARLRGVVAETKSGRLTLEAPVVVDASADADVATLAGVPLRAVAKGSHSLCFRLGGVDVDAFVDWFAEDPARYPAYMDVDWDWSEALAQYRDCGTFLFPHGGGMQIEPLQRARAEGALPEHIGVHDALDACQMHALRRTGMVHLITGFVRFDGLDAAEISRAVHDGRRMAFTVADVFARYMPGFARSFVAGVADSLGVRVSRHLDGEFQFTAEMMEAGVRQPDAVGRGVGWDNVVKHPGEHAWDSQVCREDSFDLPYRCLLPRDIDGLLIGAGRSISTPNPWLLRAMVPTMIVGQAAGTAAAVSAREGCAPRAVSVPLVQEEMVRQGLTPV